MKKGAGLIEHIPKRQTAKRMADAALMLFNRFGEPSVMASAIAADVGISHGNLHYHYPSKQKIVGICSRSSGMRSGTPSPRPKGGPYTLKISGFSCI